MFELKKLCDAYEDLTAAEKGLILTEKSIKIIAKLHCLSVPGIDPVQTLAGFIIGSAVADGKINEQEYLLIYPYLTRIFGEDFDFASVKESFRKNSDVISEYTEKCWIFLDDELRSDVISLCLCVTAID